MSVYTGCVSCFDVSDSDTSSTSQIISINTNKPACSFLLLTIVTMTNHAKKSKHFALGRKSFDVYTSIQIPKTEHFLYTFQRFPLTSCIVYSKSEGNSSHGTLMAKNLTGVLPNSPIYPK